MKPLYDYLIHTFKRNNVSLFISGHEHNIQYIKRDYENDNFSEEIIFTSGATESNNLAIKGLKSHILRGKNHFISLNTEHKCVLEALRKLEIEGAKVTILKVNKN